MKEINQKGFTVIEILLIVVFLALIGAGSYGIYNKNIDTKETSVDNSSRDSLEQDSLQLSIDGITIEESKYYQVDLINNQSYYGKIVGLDNSFFMLSPVFYRNTVDGVVTLVALGLELHGPESAMYVNRANVQGVSELDSTSGTIKSIKEYGDKISSIDIKNPRTVESQIKSSQLQAVFFKGGAIYFTNIFSITDPKLSFDENNTYYLRYDADASTPSLSKASPSVVDVFTTADIIFWENLKPDGQVSTAIDKYDRTN